ncbi:hypothetical protein GGTG_05809 [Gaeumannomyces tritici R3-111a-1]|uniref:Uncharacterized protein n=1 Tax=Gaeumannomyces tritici (strain R3-111a-1) TaxID=644352 RepID=J3NWZ9_GAET3|nr:hypothetical protein GGTG_05809 [Gaeumannomyces tritici R3-111a-1]EJT75881.1 hypothetical protein GGTG_05809 [Gaeumannomyces tritici R3-111a-1]
MSDVVVAVWMGLPSAALEAGRADWRFGDAKMTMDEPEAAGFGFRPCAHGSAHMEAPDGTRLGSLTTQRWLCQRP